MKKTTHNMTMGMSLGMCFGVAVGLSYDKLGLTMGLCLGTLLGTVIGMIKDKAINEQIEKKCYTIKSIDKDDLSDGYIVTIVDKQGGEQTVNVTVGTMETEQFVEGNVVFLDEEGDIEQAYGEDE